MSRLGRIADQSSRVPSLRQLVAWTRGGATIAAQYGPWTALHVTSQAVLPKLLERLAKTSIFTFPWYRSLSWSVPIWILVLRFSDGYVRVLGVVARDDEGRLVMRYPDQGTVSKIPVSDIRSQPIAELLLEALPAETPEVDWRPDEMLPEDFYGA